AAQLAVIRLRMTEPELRRPFRVPLGIRWRGSVVPLPSVLGALLTAAIFVAAMVTHAGARYGGPVWLGAGTIGYVMVRRRRGADNSVEVRGRTIRARSIGEAIVQAAEEDGVDLIVLGSSPRWRRQSRFFSPTVDYVLRKSPAEVLIVAFPQGVLEG